MITSTTLMSMIITTYLITPGAYIASFMRINKDPVVKGKRPVKKLNQKFEN